MPLIGLLGALALVTVVTLWCFIKAVRIGVQSENQELLQQATGKVIAVYQLFLAGVLAFGFGPAIVDWVGTVIALLGRLV